MTGEEIKKIVDDLRELSPEDAEEAVLITCTETEVDAYHEFCQSQGL